MGLVQILSGAARALGCLLQIFQWDALIKTLRISASKANNFCLSKVFCQIEFVNITSREKNFVLRKPS
jgi:hypothetical protein